jgi:hypothetical protein
MKPSRRRSGTLFVLAAALAIACAPARPPFTQATSAAAPQDPHQATVVFLWPGTSCDTGGYYTLATGDGKFVGNIASGSQLTVSMAPGNYTLLGWSESRAADDGSLVGIPVMHATLAEGQKYFVRMAFGEWNDTGPREMHMRRSGQRVCFRVGDVMSSAMIALTPSSEEWSDVPTWTRELQALSSDSAAGQAWLDANRDRVTAHSGLAKTRFEGLKPIAKRLATLGGAEGASP